MWRIDHRVPTTERPIEVVPDVVRRFLQATEEGLAWATEDPSGAVDLFRPLDPETNRAAAWTHGRVAVDHVLTPTTQQLGLGPISRGGMEFTRDTTIGAFNLPVKERGWSPSGAGR